MSGAFVYLLRNDFYSSLRSSHDSAFEDSSLSLIIGVALTNLLIIGAAILAFLIIRRRLREKSKKFFGRIELYEIQ